MTDAEKIEDLYLQVFHMREDLENVMMDTYEAKMDILNVKRAINYKGRIDKLSDDLRILAKQAKTGKQIKEAKEVADSMIP